MMTPETALGSRERIALAAVAALGLLGTNGVFIYHLFFRQEAVAAALANPVAVAFMMEALAVTALAARIIARRGGRPGWVWFVGLSLLGGLLFSIPAHLVLADASGKQE